MVKKTVVELDRYGFANGIILKDPQQFKIEVRRWKNLHPNCILKFKKLKVRIRKNRCFLPKGWKIIKDNTKHTNCGGCGSYDPLPTDIRNGYINGVGGYD